jgi:hypothetical protein
MTAAFVQKQARVNTHTGRLVLVHLSRQRTLEPVRQDGCFAEKQGPGPALLLIVRCSSLVGREGRVSLPL